MRIVIYFVLSLFLVGCGANADLQDMFKRPDFPTKARDLQQIEARQGENVRRQIIAENIIPPFPQSLEPFVDDGWRILWILRQRKDLLIVIFERDNTLE